MVKGSSVVIVVAQVTATARVHPLPQKLPHPSGTQKKKKKKKVNFSQLKAIGIKTSKKGLILMNGRLPNEPYMVINICQVLTGDKVSQSLFSSRIYCLFRLYSEQRIVKKQSCRPSEKKLASLTNRICDLI